MGHHVHLTLREREDIMLMRRPQGRVPQAAHTGRRGIVQAGQGQVPGQSVVT